MIRPYNREKKEVYVQTSPWVGLPRASKYPIFQKNIQGMAFGTRSLKYRVLGPSGLLTRLQATRGDAQSVAVFSEVPRKPRGCLESILATMAVSINWRGPSRAGGHTMAPLRGVDTRHV